MQRTPKRALQSSWWSTAVGLILVLAPGCASRTLTIESDPPGALVYLDWTEVGTTPITMPFTYGGTHDILLLHEEGDVKYKPIRVRREVSNFMFDTFPFDLFVALTPAELRDDHVLHFDLEPSELVATLEVDEETYVGALLRRAEALRARARQAQQEGPPEAPPLLPTVDKTAPIKAPAPEVKNP